MSLFIEGTLKHFGSYCFRVGSIWSQEQAIFTDRDEEGAPLKRNGEVIEPSIHYLKGWYFIGEFLVRC